MKTIYTLTTILLLSSCAFHSGTITSNTTDQPVVHKDVAIGVASTNIVFNIGGLSKDAVISEARKNMIRSRPLEGAEQFNNVEVNIKNTYYIIGHKTKVTIHADVIAPKDSINQPSYSKNYLKKIAVPQPGGGLFAIGDSILVYNFNRQPGQIVRFSGKNLNRVEISYTDSKNSKRTKKVSMNRVFIAKKEHRGLVRLSRTEDGIIIGFGADRALVKMTEGYTTIKYPEKKKE